MTMLEEIEQAIKDAEEYGASDFIYEANDLLDYNKFMWMFKKLKEIKEYAISCKPTTGSGLEHIIKLIEE